jgi:hypothetical protein
MRLRHASRGVFPLHQPLTFDGGVRSEKAASCWGLSGQRFSMYARKHADQVMRINMSDSLPGVNEARAGFGIIIHEPARSTNVHGNRDDVISSFVRMRIRTKLEITSSRLPCTFVDLAGSWMMIPKPARASLTPGSESLILIRMTWSACFRAYIEKRWPESPQQEAAFSLRTPPSNVSGWCNGKTPRDAWRRRIATWSKGAVPADLQVGRAPAARRTGTDG